MSKDESVAAKAFNLEETLGVLEALAHDGSRSPEQGVAIESAAKALHFIRRLGKLDDFRDYLRDFDADPGPATRVMRSFASLSEATEWLRAQQDPSLWHHGGGGWPSTPGSASARGQVVPRSSAHSSASRARERAVGRSSRGAFLPLKRYLPPPT